MYSGDSQVTATPVGNRHASVSNRRPRKGRMKLVFVWLFLIGLILPIQLFVGPLRLSPYRIVLLVALFPCLITLFSGRCGKIRLPDVLIFLYATWAAIALFWAHRVDAVEPAGIHTVETLGSYFIARCYIRSAREFRKVVQILLIAIIVLIPVALFESLTDRNILLDALSTVFTVHARWDIEGRLGLQRAMAAFEHPILYGIFCASALGLVFYVLGHGRISPANCLRAGLVAIATFFSLSAGPLLALVSQFGLMGWDKLASRIPHRWAILCGLVLLAYVTVDLLSNRSPAEVFISYLTFTPRNSYNRILIWQYGTAEVLRHPVFGIGLNEWVRAPWMSTSMDNFWLAKAVRYGLPCFGFLAAALLTLCASVARMRVRDKEVKNCRLGWFVTIMGMVIAGGTVAYWNAIYCLFMFLIGSGVWMLDYNLTKNPRAGRRKLEHKHSPRHKNGANLAIKDNHFRS